MAWVAGRILCCQRLWFLSGHQDRDGRLSPWSAHAILTPGVSGWDTMMGGQGILKAYPTSGNR